MLSNQANPENPGMLKNLEMELRKVGAKLKNLQKINKVVLTDNLELLTQGVTSLTVFSDS